MTKIVVVEDQQALAIVYRNKFIAEGYQVEVAADGEAGLDLINSAEPDLVMLDLMLPKLNGIEVLKRVRANPLFPNLPVIIFSNASLPGMVEDAWKAGATMVLSKSDHSPNQIVESVRSVLKAASESKPNAASATAKGANATSPDVLASSRSRAATGHVLLVEDNAEIRALLSFLLDQAGHQFTMVDSHAAALDKVKLGAFDLYLINRACPDGLGLTLCPQLRQLIGQQPIVMYSSAALPTEQQAALDGGASVYLTKPNEILNIGKLLSHFMKESKASVALAGTPAASPVAV
jgi:CheY-like chemotaxis protein